MIFPSEIVVVTPVSVSSRTISLLFAHNRRTLVSCNNKSKTNLIMKNKLIYIVIVVRWKVNFAIFSVIDNMVSHCLLDYWILNCYCSENICKWWLTLSGFLFGKQIIFSKAIFHSYWSAKTTIILYYDPWFDKFMFQNVLKLVTISLLHNAVLRCWFCKLLQNNLLKNVF